MYELKCDRKLKEYEHKLNRSKHAPLSSHWQTQASFTRQCMSLTKKQLLVMKENMVTKATEVDLKN